TVIFFRVNFFLMVVIVPPLGKLKANSQAMRTLFTFQFWVNKNRLHDRQHLHDVRRSPATDPRSARRPSPRRATRGRSRPSPRGGRARPPTAAANAWSDPASGP